MYYISCKLADGDNYIPVPCAVQVEELIVVADADAGAVGSVTLSDGTDTINVATCDGDTAGTVTNGAKDATNGNKTIPAGGVLKLVCSSTNVATFGCTMAIDEYLIGNR